MQRPDVTAVEVKCITKQSGRISVSMDMQEIMKQCVVSKLAA
jgi:hypothetical protein